jgi:hypothetical protein
MSLRKLENPELFRANIRKKIYDILEDEKNSINLEKGIFNFTLKEAELRKIVKKNNCFLLFASKSNRVKKMNR